MASLPPRRAACAPTAHFLDDAHCPGVHLILSAFVGVLVTLHSAQVHFPAWADVLV